MSKFLIFILLSIGFCSPDDLSQQECSEELICTKEYKSVLIKVRNVSGNAVVLDSYHSLNKLTGEVYNFSDNLKPTGTYTVLTDSQMSDVEKTGTIIEFHGSANGIAFIEEFTIGHDCCHIIKLNGQEEVIFNPQE